MSEKEINEIELIMHGTEDGKEITIVLKADARMTNEDVILELEYYINELSRADEKKNQPGTRIH